MKLTWVQQIIESETKYEQGLEVGFGKGHSVGWREGFKQGRAVNSKIPNSNFSSFIEKSNLEVGIDTKKDPQITKPAGRRVQDLSLLAEGISELTCCKLCCGKLELVKEKNIQGLSSSLVWSCMSCKEELAIPTSHMIKSNIPKGKPRSEVNLLAVGGMEMIGKGYAGLNSFLTHLDIPSMSHTTFDKTALFIGKAAQQVVEESLNKAHVEEKEKLVQKGVQMDQHGNLVDEGITDAGWQKRSYNHNCNSLSGVGVLVGKETGKVMDFEVLTVNCKKCATAETIGKEVEPHNCTALWKGSAKSMEPEMAARMWSRSGHYGIHFSTQVGDEDSATQKKLQEEVPDNLKPTKKKSDFLHIKRNFTNHLYNLKSKYRGIMSKMVITKLVVDFGAAIKTNCEKPRKNLSQEPGKSKTKSKEFRKSVTQLINKSS